VDVGNTGFTPGFDFVEAHGTFNGWNALPLVEQGSSTIYTNTVNDTADPNGGKLEYKFVIDGGYWESPATGVNRAVRLPATSGDSLVLPMAYFDDDGMPAPALVTFQVDVSQQIALGSFIPGVSWVEVRGRNLPNSWYGGNLLTPNPAILRTNQYGMVTSNVWVGTFSVTGSPGGADEFKYYLQPAGQWDTPSPVNQDDNGNRYFADTPKTLPAVNFSDGPSAITFNVDISMVAALDPNFNPYSLTLNGDFNNWGGLTMTNNPTAPNPSLYSVVVYAGAGSTLNYQYRYTEGNTGNIVYDLANGISGNGQNRSLVVPNVLAINLPPVFFNDAAGRDYLTQPAQVTFSVDMNNAMGTDGHPFDPNNDTVYLNGQFLTWYPWSTYFYYYDPAPLGFQMVEAGGSTIYTNTITLAAGTLVGFKYKYGMDPGDTTGGPFDDEAPLGQNHFRVLRSPAASPYVLPMDTFGRQYAEPYFNASATGGAGLKIGRPVLGRVPVSWLGQPGVHLQVKTNLLSSAWQDLWATDGTNWIAGYPSTNGLVSQTNWPATSRAFFRVVKP